MKRKLHWILLLGVLWLLFPVQCYAQTQPADTFDTHLKNKLTAYYRNYPQEKIFIHTSQHTYASGQTLWYKVYAQAYGKPSELSKIVYLQLADAKGKLLIQQKLPLKYGMAHGDINLPDSLKTGWYLLTGFTSWMMNFGEDTYYHQPVYIQNTADTIHHASIIHAAEKYHVDFFPESGDLVTGNACNVAFRATDDKGGPVAIYGDVTDNSKQAIAKITTVHDGMGVFSLEPAAGNSYMAIIHFPDKSVQLVALPSIKKEGIMMQVSSSGADLELKVSYSGSPEKYKYVLLAAFQNNGRLITYPLELGRGINVFGISKQIFSSGILRLTLFDHEHIPAAERLFFIDNHDQLNLQLKADTISRIPHQQQVFSLLMPGAGNQLKGNFSVSVTDADADVNNSSADNICSSFLVSSELRGTIHDPGWYFNNNNDSLHQALDLVMLTNGWRHFTWAAIEGKAPSTLRYPVEKTQYIAGRIIGYVKPANSKQQLAIKLLIQNQDSSKFIGYVYPDSTGRFILNDYNHQGTSTLYIETTDNKNHIKKLKIALYKTLDDSLRTVKGSAYDWATGMTSGVTNKMLSTAKLEKEWSMQTEGISLRTVVIKDKMISPTQQIINDHVSPLYTSVHEFTLDLVHNPSLDIGFINYIQGKFPGLRITDGANPIFTYRGSNTLQGSTNSTVNTGSANNKQSSNNISNAYAGDDNTIAVVAKPYFFLNEQPVSFEDVINIPMQEIALIRFMPPPVVFAPYNGGNVGAILVYTKNNKDERSNISSQERFDKYTFNGYAITREFSSPDYNKIKNMITPDNRITLYWSHDLVPDNTGHVKFRFYNSDKARKYHIVIQGMDADGRLGYVDEVF